MSHCTYLITTVSTSGTARTDKGGPSISLDRARHSCQSWLGREILRTSYQQSCESRQQSPLSKTTPSAHTEPEASATGYNFIQPAMQGHT